MADGTTEPIGRIKPGESVEAADPGTGKHQGPHTVLATLVNHDHDLIDLAIDTGHGHTATLHTTAEHPFHDATTHTWTPAGKLPPGHTLTTEDGQPARIKTITHTPAPPTATTSPSNNSTRTMCWRGPRRFWFTTAMKSFIGR
jgi:hypothetical protein